MALLVADHAAPRTCAHFKQVRYSISLYNIILTRGRLAQLSFLWRRRAIRAGMRMREKNREPVRKKRGWPYQLKIAGSGTGVHVPVRASLGLYARETCLYAFCVWTRACSGQLGPVRPVKLAARP